MEELPSMNPRGRTWSLFCTCFPDLRGCHAIPSPETPVEIGEIAKADVVSDDAYRTAVELHVAQHSIGACKALTEQEGGKCRAVGLKQPLKIAWRDPQMVRNSADRKVMAGAVFDNVSLCRSQPGRTQSFRVCRPRGVARCAERQRDQIMQVIDGQVSEEGRGKRVAVDQC